MHEIDNYPAISEYNAEIDLIGLEKRTREFVNNGDNIQGKEALKYKNCTIMLPLVLLEPNQFLENLKKLEKRISYVIKDLNNYNDLIREGQYPAIPGSNNDFIQLTKIADGLSAEAEFEFVGKEELPDTSLEVQNTSRVGILSWLGFSSY